MKDPIRARVEYYRATLHKAAKALEERGWEAHVCDGVEEAKEIVMDLAAGRRVGIPGSTTVRELGLVEALAGRADVIQHWDRSGAMDALREEPSCDVFLHSANAVALTGELVIVDFYGNRVVGSAMGPETLVIVAGRNKVVRDLEEAVRRAHEVAARINALRFSTTPEEITAFTLVLHRRPPLIRRGVVLLVNEELGY